MVEWSDAQIVPSVAKPVHLNTSFQVALQTCSFWLTHWNFSLANVPSTNSQRFLKTARDQSSSSRGQLLNCAQICASLWFHTSFCTQMNSSGHSGWKQGPKDMSVPSCVQVPALMHHVWADTKIAEGSLWKFRDCPGARSSPNRRWQGSEAFGVACDPAVGANLVPGWCPPRQPGALPPGLHSRGAHRASLECCSLFSPNEHVNLITPPSCKLRIRD